MEDRIQRLLEVEGVNVTQDLSDDLADILKAQDLTSTQCLFLQQQLAASRAKSSCGIRWHPSMIRFALALYMASPACYQTARDSGMIRLPSQRTLFDYSHVVEAREGVKDIVLEQVCKRIESFQYPYQKYHALLCDEMHICQNLVYRKSTGEMLGYVKLSEAAADVQALQNFLESGNSKVKPELASKMLSFMIKGTASNVKEVVASFSVSRLTTEFLYEKTWEVINRCERSGIAIIAFVSDGCSINRSFMKRHTPVLVSNSNLIYATYNKCAPDRLLYFMSDVAHLIKTIRNCLNNSGISKKSKRCMQKNGEKLVWQTIINLYRSKKEDNLRNSYKLTSQNIYLDSYSAMKVKYAAELLSKTVAKNIEDMNWPGTKELVRFIRLVNDWFDSLNGAFSLHGIKTRNKNLNPYTSPEDSRFQEMENFLQYLREWKEEAHSVDALARNLSQSFQDDNISFDPVPEGEREEELQAPEEIITPAAKRLLSAQTMEGIEFTTLAFIACCKFLLEEGTKFINARVFSQDHLEQHFSKQRHRTAGSSNPNYGRFLQNDLNIHIQGQLGVRKRKSNTEHQSDGMKVTTDPLPKRRAASHPLKEKVVPLMPE